MTTPTGDLGPTGVSPGTTGVGSLAGARITTGAAMAPSIDNVRKEALAQAALTQMEQDFGDDTKLPRKKLACNWKMVLGIVVGVLVGLIVLAVVLGAVVASHGALGAVFGIVATKLSLGSALAAHGMAGAYVGAAGLAWIAKGISAIAVAAVFLGGGKIGGDLWRQGEAEQMDALLEGEEVRFLETNCGQYVGRLTEEEIQGHIAGKQATILSSQAGRNFVEAGRMAHLHYTGPVDVITSLIKAFGHFWTSVPSISLQSIFDRAQYDMFCKNVELERHLKEDSVEGDQVTPAQAQNSLDQLNALRATQVEQLVWRTDAMGVAYAAAPEIQVYDRNIAKLEVLKIKLEKRQKGIEETISHDSAKEAEFQAEINSINASLTAINNQIAVEKEKKSLLIAKRLGDRFVAERLIAGSVNLGNSIFASKNAPVKSLLTIGKDVMSLPNLSNERRGQILEAVSILLTQNPKTTINDVNELAGGLVNLFEQYDQGTAQYNQKANSKRKLPDWSTRSQVIEKAKSFASAKLNGSDPSLPAFELALRSYEKAPMTRESGSFYALRALDVFISVVHMIPIPGSSVVAAGLTGAAVAVEKGVGPSQLASRVSGLFQRCVNTELPQGSASAST